MKNLQKIIAAIAFIVLCVCCGVTAFSAGRIQNATTRAVSTGNTMSSLMEQGQELLAQEQELAQLTAENKKDGIIEDNETDTQTGNQAGSQAGNQTGNQIEAQTGTQMENQAGASESESGGEDSVTGGEPESNSADSAVNTENESEQTVAKNGHIVGIDPGHQGSWVDMSEQEPDGPGSGNYKAKATTGTMGRFTGVPEYELNLTISLALREELESRGYEVVLTREDNDTAISNAERAQKAAAEGSEIYVRIHANGSDDTSVRGALAMTPSPNNPYVAYLAEDSYRLSECILNSYCAATGFGNLGIQYYDNMTGINWSTVPVMILEMGFMTNESEDYAMQDPAMQKLMVQGIADGIDAYFA